MIDNISNRHTISSRHAKYYTTDFLEDAMNLVHVSDWLHVIEPVDRNPEHQLIFELGVDDLHITLVVATVANLLDVPFN